MRTPVKKLSAEYCSAKPLYFDLGERDDWLWWSSVTCETCGHTYVGDKSETYCPKCDSTNYDDPPMYNYLYPVSIDRAGGFDEAVLAAGKAGLCLVEWDEYYYLALGGAGMDMSWEICEAYMFMGYLPPTHFANLPSMAGLRKNARVKWILAGVRRSLRLSRLWLEQDLRHIRHLSTHMG